MFLKMALQRTPSMTPLGRLKLRKERQDFVFHHLTVFLSLAQRIHRAPRGRQFSGSGQYRLKPLQREIVRPIEGLELESQNGNCSLM